MFEHVTLPSGKGHEAFLKQARIELRVFFEQAYKIPPSRDFRMVDGKIDYTKLIGTMISLDEGLQNQFKETDARQLATDFAAAIKEMLNEGTAANQIYMHSERGWFLIRPRGHIPLDGLLYIAEQARSVAAPVPA